jgi:hypothetical protein
MLQQLLIECTAGGAASCVAEIATLPLDTIKVFLQTNKTNISFYDAFRELTKKSGLSSLFVGMQPAVYR